MFVAGLLAHLIASYSVAVAVVALRTLVAGPPPVAVFVAIALSPLLVPIGFILPTVLTGTVFPGTAGAIVAYVALFVLGYRRLRTPRGT
jgi:hypothetical protein